MNKNNNKDKFWDRIRRKSRFVIMNPNTFEEKFSSTLTPLNIYTLIGFFVVLILFFAYFLLGHTSLNKLMPQKGSKVENTDLALIYFNLKLDSLAIYADQNFKYIDRTRKILAGESFDDSAKYAFDSINIINPNKIKFGKSKEDSIFRAKMESESDFEGMSSDVELFQGLLLYPPVKGKISQSFNYKKGHLGIDVTTQKDEAIKVVLNGTIIYSGWSSDDGNFLVVTHSENIVSIYKHCSSNLKNTGDIVQAGDPIAIVGNTGENSTAPHLHFELWLDGTAVDPFNFISFE